MGYKKSYLSLDKISSFERVIVKETIRAFFTEALIKKDSYSANLHCYELESAGEGNYRLREVADKNLCLGTIVSTKPLMKKGNYLKLYKDNFEFTGIIDNGNCIKEKNRNREEQ